MSVQKEALERHLTPDDRRRIFQALGFQINGQQPNDAGFLTNVRFPRELGEGKHANGSVNLETGAVKDFGSTDYRGDLYRAVMDVRGCTFPEALEWVAEQIGYRSKGTEEPVTLRRLAEAKGFTPSFLRSLGVEQIQPGKLRITYRDKDGIAATVRQRLRTAVSAKEGSLWEKGSRPIVPYGLWLLDRMLARHSYGLMLEGESDPWTAWKHGLPALGIPGKSMHGVLELEHVEDFEQLYVGIEADEAGQQFARNMQERLQEIGYEGDVYALPFTEETPDLNDLYLSDPDRFEERLGRMMENAQTLKEWLQENTGAADEAPATEAEAKEAETKTQPPDYVPFPVDALPSPAADYVRACAKAVGCAPAMTALPLLAALSAAVGSAARLRLKRSWREPAPLWTMLVAPSGSAKSPALKHSLRPVYRREREAKEHYERELQAYEKAKKKSEEAQKPKRRRYRTGDATPESVMKLLGENPRGLLLARNELGAWLGSFDRYAQGASDLQFWIEVWDGQQASRDRVTENVTVDRPAVSVTGTIQPGALREKLTELHFESGFAARFLLSMPPTRPLQWTEADVTREVEDAFDKLLVGLYEVPMGTEVELTPEAKKLWVGFYNRANEEAAGLEGPAKAAYIKGVTHGARLTLILHLAEVGGEAAEAVSAGSMQRGLHLGRWLRNETLRVYEVLELTEEALSPQQRFLRKLPSEFKTAEAEALAQEEGIPRSTMFDWLKKLTETGNLQKVRRGLYCNTSSVGLWTNRTKLHKDDAGSRENVKKGPESPKSNVGNASEPRHSASPFSGNGHSGSEGK